MSAYYQRLEQDRLAPDPLAQDQLAASVSHFQSTDLVQGAWNPHEQHMAAVAGVISAELEQFQPRDDMRIARISFDIWGLIPAGEFSVETKVIRAGRTIELIEATLMAQARTCIVARAWRMQVQDTTAIAGLEDGIQQRPSYLPVECILDFWNGRFVRTVKSQVDLTTYRAGKGMVWLNTEVDMIEGETTTDFVRLMGMIDTANGVSPRMKKGQWLFPNVDLQVHLLRKPQGHWLGLETMQQFGEDGIGITSSVLHDDHGVFGRCEQILTLRQISAA